MKDKKMSIRISQQDLDKIHHKANQAGKSFTDYVTSVCLGKKIIRIDGLEEVWKQQKAVGNNLNQLGRLANMGRLSVVYLQETQRELQKIEDAISELFRRKVE